MLRIPNEISYRVALYCSTCKESDEINVMIKDYNEALGFIEKSKLKKHYCPNCNNELAYSIVTHVRLNPSRI